jgi:hypothetical protein
MNTNVGPEFQVIAYRPSYLKFVRTPKAALLLCQLEYWQSMAGGPFHKSAKEICKSTGLTRNQQETALRGLLEGELVRVALMGLPRTVDVRPHPHIGLSTITYLFDGEIMHRDSVGSEQAILPGEVNWMTAGRGITHSERFERARLEGGSMHGIQAWVAMPERDEESEPAFFHHGAA